MRAMICVAAVYLVAQGVTWNDEVRLRSGERLMGRVAENGDAVTVEHSGGETRVLSRTSVVLDKKGSPGITYGLRTAWGRSRKGLLLLAILVNLPVVLLQALRFRWLLGAQGITVSFWECLKLSLAGNFLNFATPLGSHAGDAFKAYFVSLHTDRRTEAVTTVVLDRIVGLGTLLLVTGLIVFLSPSTGPLSVLKPYVAGAGCLGLVGTGIYASPWFHRLRIPVVWVGRFAWLAHLRRADAAVRALAGRWSVLAASIALTAFLQGLALTAYLLTALALSLNAGWREVPEFFAYFYTGSLIQALPGPPQGLGTVELAYRLLFAPFGSPSQIVCMALAIRIVVFICALPGLLVTLTGSYRPQDVPAVDFDSPSPSASSKSDLACTG